MSVFLDAALAYAKRGWPVFPCHPKSKIPATPHGFKDASTDERLIRQWWEFCPDYNVAIATGEVSGTFVLDLDDKPGRSVDEALSSLGLTWPETPTVRTGGGGVQLVYAFPAGSDLSISGGKLGFGIDTRGNGGYVVAPPSIHPNGVAYKWMDCEDAPLAPTPAVIIEKLKTQRTKAFLSSGEKLSGGRHHTLMTAAALARGVGFVPREIAAALREMVHRLDLSDGRVVTEKEISDIASWTADKDMGVLNIEAVVHGDQIVASLAKGMGEALSEVAKKDENDPGPLPERLLNVPGFIGKLAAYTNDHAHRPQPLFAMAGALAALSVLTGRKVQTESGARSNLYLISVAPSGAGKDAARTTTKALFVAAGCDSLLGAEDFASDAGVVSAVEQSPAVLFQIDEIGHLLRAVMDEKASPHLAGIAAVLMRLYTSAAGPFKGKAYRDAKSTPVIQQPHAVLYGTTTPARFWSSISRSAIEDGLLGRCLVFTGEMTAQRKVRRKPLPADLVEEARWWFARPCGRGNLATVNPDPELVPYDDEGEAAIDALGERAEVECMERAGTIAGALWARAVQRVDQLALLYACSRDREKPVIDAEAVGWARDLTLWLTAWTTWAADRHVAENQAESTTKRVLRLIEDAGDDGLTSNELGRACRWLKSRERGDVVRDLAETGDIALVKRQTGGRAAMVYIHRKNLPPPTTQAMGEAT